MPLRIAGRSRIHSAGRAANARPRWHRSYDVTSRPVATLKQPQAFSSGKFPTFTARLNTRGSEADQEPFMHFSPPYTSKTMEGLSFQETPVAHHT